MIAEGPGLIQFDPPLIRMTQRFRGEGGAEALAATLGEQQIVGEGLVMYMKSPFFQQLMGSGDKWLKIDLQAASEQMGVDLSQLMQSSQSDPSGQLQYLAGATQVEKVGTEKVRGVETTHYTGVVDFEVLKQEEEELADTIDRVQEIYGGSEVPFEVWLDKEGLPARYSMDFDYSNSPSAAQMGRMKMTFEYFDWGVPVSVDIPPESQTVDMIELMQQQQEQTQQ